MTTGAEQSGGGIDGGQLRALLRCYWRLGTRGKLSASMGRARAGKNRGLGWILGTYAIVGLMTCPMMAAYHVDIFTFSLIVDSMTLFFVAMSAIAESGDVLFSVSEADVLTHRPILPATLLLAKAINLMALTMLLAGALNFFPTIFAMSARGAMWWFPLVHFCSLVLLCACCASAVVCTYGLIVRLFDREKFDNIAAWTQVAMSIIFVTGYQFVPRMMPRMARMDPGHYAAYLFPLPPAWFAGIDALGSTYCTMPVVWALAAMGVLATAGLGYAAIWKLAPSYGEAMARLGEARGKEREATGARAKRRDWMRAIEWFVRDPVERASFRLATAYMWRDRLTKLRLYPSLSIFVIVPLLNVLSPRPGQSTFVQFISVWMLCALPVMALETLRVSAHPAAAEIFYTSPMGSAGRVFLGVRKAVLVCIVLPLVAVVVIAILVCSGDIWVSGPITLTGLLAIPTVSLLPALARSYVPLSKPPLLGGQISRNSVVMIASTVVVLFVSIFANTAWESGLYAVFLAVECGVLLTAHVLAMIYIRRRRLVVGADD